MGSDVQLVGSRRTWLWNKRPLIDMCNLKRHAWDLRYICVHVYSQIMGLANIRAHCVTCEYLRVPASTWVLACVKNTCDSEYLDLLHYMHPLRYDWGSMRSIVKIVHKKSIMTMIPKKKIWWTIVSRNICWISSSYWCTSMSTAGPARLVCTACKLWLAIAEQETRKWSQVPRTFLYAPVWALWCTFRVITLLRQWYSVVHEF